MIRTWMKVGFSIVFLIGMIGGISQAAAQTFNYSLEGYDYVDGQLLIKFNPAIGSERSQQVLTELGLTHLRTIHPLGVQLLGLPPGLSVEKALEVFSRRTEVLYAEPNYILTVASSLEAEVVDQWGLTKIEAPQAWGLLPDPAPVVIAVVDTGIDRGNPDLADNMWVGPDAPSDGIDNDNNGYVDDWWGWDFVNSDNDPMDDQMHGTAVSSVAAGNLDGLGVAGVCPWCKLMAVKVLSADGSGSLDVAATGIIYAANQGAAIINLSMSAPQGMKTLQDAIDHAWNAGTLVVAAAGNDGQQTSVYPAAYLHAMSVASTDSDDHHSCFSNYSDGYISVAAPGSNVTFAYLGGGLRSGSGTSLAAPHVAGLAGLLLTKTPTLTNQELWDLIEASANDLGPVGVDAYFGAGRINAYRAVVGDTSPTNPPDEEYILVDDPTAYGHATKLARSSDGTLHRVWYDLQNGEYQVQYAFSLDNGANWSEADLIFSSTSETYHPAIALDQTSLYVVFPTREGSANYEVRFTTKPVSGGDWSQPVGILGGGFNAVRPDIYLDPSNNRLHVVASSLEDAPYVYYRSSNDGGVSWNTVRNINFVYQTRYASVYAYGDMVYVASRMTDGMLLIPTFYLSMMRSLDGGNTWQDRMLFDSHTALLSSEYGMSLTGYEEWLFILYEHNGQIRFGKSMNGVNWNRVFIYDGGGMWPTITTSPDGQAWFSWLNDAGVVMLRQYLGGAVNESASYTQSEELYSARYPNFKEGVNYNRVEWVTTDCSGAPFGLAYDFRAAGGNMPPYAFISVPTAANVGTAVQFDASTSYDPDGDPLSFNWDFGDGSFGSGPTPSHVYESAGTFSVTLTLSDGSSGVDTASAQIEVQQGANQPPSAEIGGPYSGSEDSAIQFDGSSSSDPDGDTLMYSWDFGDGNLGSGVNPMHTYTYGGTFTVRLTVSDGISGDDTAETQVVVQEVNDQPVVVHNGPYSALVGEVVQFDASGSFDPDNLDASSTNNQTLSYHWDFGDGSTSTEIAPTHLYTSASVFSVTLTVSDGSPLNGTASATSTATISVVSQASSHVGDLDGGRLVNRNKWSAQVTVTVHDDQHAPVSGALVSGTWSSGYDGTGSCTTDAAGQCSLFTPEIRKNIPSAVFTVDTIQHSSLSYDQVLNHDPDGDSDGTSITVFLEAVSEPTPTPTPGPSPSSSLHIGDLDGIGAPVRSKWEAVVTIHVHDENENPLVGVTITGAWSEGGEASCVTGGDGLCTVVKNNLKTSVTSISFLVTDAALSGYSYQPGSNHDPDGDSDGTTIVISAP